MAPDVKTPADKAVDRYLERYDQALQGIVPARREELVQEMIERIVEARWELPDRDDDAAVRDVLKRIGPPEEVAFRVRAANLPPEPAATHGEDGREKLAILLLLFGGFAGGIGWLVGVVLLWLSPRWRDRDKLIGTFVVPGGLALSAVIFLFALGTAVTDGTACAATGDYGCSDDTMGVPPGLLLVAGVVLLAPIAVAAHLWSRLGATRGPHA